MFSIIELQKIYQMMEKRATLERTVTMPTLMRSKDDLGRAHVDVGRRMTVIHQKKNHVYDVIPELLTSKKPVIETPLKLKDKQARQSASSDMYGLPPGLPSSTDNDKKPSLHNCHSPVYIAPPLLQFDQKGTPVPGVNNKDVDVST